MVQVREGNAMDHCGQQWLFFAVVYILRELVEFLFLYSINCSVSKLCRILHNEMIWETIENCQVTFQMAKLEIYSSS